MKALLALLLLTFSATAVSADIYTWKDGKGTRFYTNSLHEIPAKYLKRARVLDVATGKLGGLATAQPPAPAEPAPVVAGRASIAQPFSPPPSADAASPDRTAPSAAISPPAAAATVSPEPEPQVRAASRARRPSSFAERRAARRARAVLD